jgi:hypothetical protein
MELNPRLFVLPDAEIQQHGFDNLIYGSLTNKGLKTLIKTIHTVYSCNEIYGLDLGCGDGELIYHLEKDMPGSVWEGVEISHHRVAMQKRDVIIWEGDMLEENLRPYNILHADNLCLDDNTADLLEEKIIREFTGLYISYRTPHNTQFLKHAHYIATIPAETTWTTHPIHYYAITALN